MSELRGKQVKTISLVMPVDMIEALDKLAAAQARTRSNTIRRLLAQGLDQSARARVAARERLV